MIVQDQTAEDSLVSSHRLRRVRDYIGATEPYMFELIASDSFKVRINLKD